MPYAVRISTLYIGQGLCNVIEVHKDDAPFSLGQIKGNDPTFADNAKLIFLAVVDMGTISSFSQQKGGALWHVAQAASFLKPLLLKRGMTLDCLHISHLDEDHYNGFAALIGQFGLGAQINVNKVVIGGVKPDKFPDEWGSEGKMLSRLSGWGYKLPNSAEQKTVPGYYVSAGRDPYEPDASPLHCSVALEGNDLLRLNVLMCRAPLVPGYKKEGYRSEDDIFVNAGSTILFVTLVRKGLGGSALASAFFPGDATWETFCEFNAKQFGFAPGFKYFVIPHHGSLRTAVNEKNPDFAAWDTLLAGVRPDLSAVSAHDLFKHPDARTLSRVYPYLMKTAPSHMVRAFTGSSYIDGNTSLGLYSTFFGSGSAPSSSSSSSSSPPTPAKTCRNIHMTYHSAHKDTARNSLECYDSIYPYGLGD